MKRFWSRISGKYEPLADVDAPRYWLRLSDPFLAGIAARGKKKLRDLWMIGIDHFHKVEKTNYWSADYRITDDNLVVAVDPRADIFFEFWTNGNPMLSGSITQGSESFTSVKAASVVTRIHMEGASVTAVSEISQGKRSLDGTEVSPIARPFQIQLADEPVAEPEADNTNVVFGRKKYWTTVYETFAPLHSHTGVHMRSYTHGAMKNDYIQSSGTGFTRFQGAQLRGSKGSVGSHGTRDLGYDIPYMDGDHENPVRFAILNNNQADWPRATGKQTVKDVTYGTRSFVIYIDAFSQVSVFPLDAIQAENGITQNVDPSMVQFSAIPLPGWVYQMSERFLDYYASFGDAGFNSFPENDWKVHPDGTKACAVVYKREAATFDSGYWGTTLLSGTWSSYCTQSTGWGSRHNLHFAGDETRYMMATGLLEATIQITLTGPNLKDFTINVGCNVVRDAGTTSYCTLFAGYVAHDLPDKTASVGDLCVWDIERYYRAPPVIDNTWSKGGGTSFEYTANFNSAFYDPELNWGYTIGEKMIHFNTNYATPPVTDAYNVGDITTTHSDVRRTLFSLKNLTQATELRTLPATPSGAVNPYVVAPANPAVQSIILGANNYTPDNGYYDNTSNSFTTTNTGLPWNIGLTYFNAIFNAPTEIRGRFLRVDMSTLSFVFQFETETQDWRRTVQNAGSPNISGGQALNFSAPFFTQHVTQAVYTFNTFRKQFFPDTMPQAYTQPSAYYTEPVQLAPYDKLVAAPYQDFRSVWMKDSDWKFMGLNDPPPLGGTDGTWTGTDLLRPWAIMFQMDSALWGVVPTQYQFQLALNTLPVELMSWWGALGVYTRPINLTFLSNPRFHWNMYSDLIQNALWISPWSTFFVHPNGTWAWFDQSFVYNPNGIPPTGHKVISGGIVAGIADVDYTTTAASCPGWNVNLLEHCVFDYVHFEFDGLDHSKQHIETSFRKLYNKAVDLLNSQTRESPLPPEKVFNPIEITDLQATFTQDTNAASLQVRLHWTKDTSYAYVDDGVPVGGTNLYTPGNNTGSADLSMDSPWGGASPQADKQRMTFSSCVLIDG